MESNTKEPNASLSSESLWLSPKEGFALMNRLGKKGTPFLFILSYDKTKLFVQTLDNLDHDIFYKLETWRNYPVTKRQKPYRFTACPIAFSEYKKAFDAIIEEIRSGNTYLLNLTFETPVETDLTLKETFCYARAKFKLYFKNTFICFSPERFVEIENNTIATYPMKGTIDANLLNAEERILSDPKEMAEHVMIVDLMRNDLGIVGNEVTVEQFRYIDRIKAGSRELLQVSSKISARLPRNWTAQLGTIFDKLTPAGSITGTPKRSTVSIIERVENYERGFYTGVFGVFDGKAVKSGVMIRFIERRDGKLYYKSGGGITIDSNAKSEYEELLNKVYLPL